MKRKKGERSEDAITIKQGVGSYVRAFETKDSFELRVIQTKHLRTRKRFTAKNLASE
jgi:hypothetical protein